MDDQNSASVSVPNFNGREGRIRLPGTSIARLEAKMDEKWAARSS